MENTPGKLIELRAAGDQVKGQVVYELGRPSRKRFALAFAVAAASDVLTLWTELIPPLQWTLDLITALLLFLILGRRWEILPGLVVEAIPGLAAFPVWVLVVLAIMLSKK